MAQMTPEVSKLLEQALSLSVEEQEALADSLISNLGGKVDEAVLAAWDDEVKKRIAELDSGAKADRLARQVLAAKVAGAASPIGAATVRERLPASRILERSLTGAAPTLATAPP